MEFRFGKYRGKVIDNVDPQRQGRLKVQVAMLEETLSWALPCVPYAGKDLGLFFLPPKGSNVWVEFEGGFVEKPIWSGCFWGEGDLPSEATSPNVQLLKMPGMVLKIDSSGVTLTLSAPTATPAVSLKLTAKGAELSQGMTHVKIGANGGITLKHNQHSLEMGAASVNINRGALEII